MKNFLKFYLVFSVIVVSFSCSEDDASSDDNQEASSLSISRFTEDVIPNTIAPKSSYVDDNTSNQLTSYFKHDNLGNIDRLTHIVFDDGSMLSTVITFDISGSINSLYQQNALTGEVFNKVYIGFENGVTYFGGDNGAGQLSQSITISNVGNFLNSADDLLFSQAINQNIEILQHFAFASSSNNRSNLILPIFGIVMVGVAVLYIALNFEQAEQNLPKDSNNMVQCDMFGECPDNRLSLESNNDMDPCSIPYSDFVCSEVVDINDNVCEDSDLEVIIEVDPGNLLVAIVNGNSVDYDFYWSTGESNTGLISDSIVVSEDGSYYLIVVDDFGCTAFASETIDSNEPVDAQLLIGPWILIGATENGTNIFSSDDCDEVMTFSQTQLTATQFYGMTEGDCSLEDTVVSSYSIENGNFLHDTLEGDTDISEILELTGETLVLRSIDGNFTYVETYSRRSIFGTWAITATECDGTDIDYTGFITLNTDFTVTQEDDSGGNYITNYFTFENNVLFIKTEYMDPVCEGTESRFQSDTVTLNYDSATDSFSGNGNTTKAEVDLPDCQVPFYNCNYSVDLSR